MPTVQGTDNFNHGDFTVPGGASYNEVLGTPTKDTTVVHATDPASLLISTAAASESVRHAVTGSPTLPWQGFWWRLALADEPAANTRIAQLNATDSAHGQLNYQPSADRFFINVAGGSEFPTSGTYTFGNWVWIEMILDTSSGTRTLYTQINGTSITPANRTIAASTGNHVELGASVSHTITSRYSNHFWGVAASTSDWMGEPASGQILLPDADLATTGWTTTPLFSKLNDSSDATVITATAS